MVVCPKCGSSNSPGAEACRTCGRKLLDKAKKPGVAEMANGESKQGTKGANVSGLVRCPSCNTYNEPDYSFCPLCGADLTAGSVFPDLSTTPAAPSPQPAQPQPAPAPQASAPASRPPVPAQPPATPPPAAPVRNQPPAPQQAASPVPPAAPPKPSPMQTTLGQSGAQQPSAPAGKSAPAGSPAAAAPPPAAPPASPKPLVSPSVGAQAPQASPAAPQQAQPPREAPKAPAPTPVAETEKPKAAAVGGSPSQAKAPSPSATAFGPIVCPKCSRENKASAEFCESCGERIAFSSTLIMTLPPPPKGRLRLIVDGLERGQAYELKEDNLIGRVDGDVTFPADGYMSGRHARIVQRGPNFVLKDEGSRNGTFVKIKSEVQLEPGDIIMIGRQFFRFET